MRLRKRKKRRREKRKTELGKKGRNSKRIKSIIHLEREEQVPL